MKKEVKQENIFDFDKVKKHIESLPSIEKIKYLIEKKTDYFQVFGIGTNAYGINFPTKCDFEISKIKTILELESSSPQTIQAFKMREAKGLKTDLIRVLNALWELKFFEKPSSGQIPSKEEFMKLTGVFFGVDLSKYDIDLSQSLNNTSLEANLKVFEDMKAVIIKNHYMSKK